MNFIKETAPHLQRHDSLNRMLLNVLIALAPVFICSAIAFPIPSLQIYLPAMATCVLCEFLFVLITKKSAKEFKMENLLSSLITAVLFAMCLPTDMGFGNGMGYVAVVIGAASGIVLGKLIFGGIGSNIFNPAALGVIVVRGFLKPTMLNASSTMDWVNTGATSIENAKTMSNIANANFMDLLLGKVPGSLGEIFRLAILIGLIYLLITRTVDWRVVVSYAGAFVVLMLAAGIVVSTKIAVNPFQFVLYHILSGGFLFGLTYMITDPVTSPVGSSSRFLFGAFGGTIVVFFRLFMGTEGVVYSILLANVIACVLDYPQWSTARWKKWHTIAISVWGVLALAAVVLVLLFKEGAIQ